MHNAVAASILVVEDEAIVARDIQNTLADLGYQVLETAASCEEAIRRSAERCPDLVLMDIRIQGQRDGIETAEVLRHRFRVPVVFLTAYADDATLERAKKAQPYGYLIKPIKSNELHSVVEVALYKHGVDARLRERERWFSTTLRSIGDAVISTDLETRVTFVNGAAEALTGWRGEDAIGRPLDEVLRLVHEETHRPVENPVRRALREGKMVRVGERVALVGKEGGERPIEEIAAPIVDDDDLLGAVIVFRDVSEERRLQRQIELTDRLASLGTMAAGVATGVSDPMASTLSNLQYASEQLDRLGGELRALFSDEAYAWLFRRLDGIGAALGEALQGADRVTRIVSELRTFARPTGQRERALDLRRVLSWAAEVVAHEVRARAGLAMQVGHLPPVMGDETRLGQVFINLLLNAVQAIAPGNARANEVRVTGRTRADGRAVIEVRDTGSGIAPELLGRIFDPFFTTKAIGASTGLGLAICHGIVRSMGGEIQIESVLGVGSVFRVVLPPAPRDRAANSNATAVAAAPGRILVVDDEPAVAAIVQRALEPEHQVVCVRTAREATALIERGESFDAVLCDLIMPEQSGMDLYDALLRTRPDVARRVVFMSGGPATARAVEFVASVSNRCLDKPFTLEAVRAAVRDAIVGG